MLREQAGVSADEVFADWVLANYFLDARRGYGYRELDDKLEPPQPVAALNSFPAAYKGELPQYSTDYITVDVRGADKLYLRLWQAPEAKLIDVWTRTEDNPFAYAVTNKGSHSRLTRAFNLDTTRQSWLEFRFWHDLDEELTSQSAMTTAKPGKPCAVITRNGPQYSMITTNTATPAPRPSGAANSLA